MRYLTSVAIRYLGAGLILLACIVAFVPIAPLFPDATLDGGWQFALNAAVARHLVFGRDIVFTFGPYASAYTQTYDPATDTRMLLSTALLALAAAAGLVCLSKGWQRLPALLLAVMLVVVTRDALFFVLPLIFLLLLARSHGPRCGDAAIPPTSAVQASLALMVAALGMLPLIKATFAAASGLALVLGFCLLALGGKWRLAGKGAAIFVLALTAFWVASGQPLTALPRFFVAQAPVIGGYSEAMALDGPHWQIGLFGLCAIIILGLHAAALRRSWGVIGLIPLCGTAGILFLAFKEGFVRQDSHVLVAAGFLAAMGLLLGLGARGAGPLLATLVGLYGWLVIDNDITGLTPAMAVQRTERPFTAAAHMLAARLEGTGLLDRAYRESLQSIRAQHPFPALHGATDVYSTGQSALLAAGVDWSPRPVLQSYSAYTPALARLDAAHLAGPSAPRNIAFAIEPFGDRLPALDDGASWPALLSAYTISAFHPGWAILARRDGGLAPGSVPALAREGSYRLGQPIPLPAGAAPLWADIVVKPTLLGRLFGLAYKPPALRLTYRFSDGHEQSYGFVAGMGRGFLASPIVQTTRDFVALALPDSASYFADRHPASLTVSAAYGAGWLWRSTVHVTLSTLAIPAQPDIGRMLFNPAVIEAARHDQLPETADCAYDYIDHQRPAPGRTRIKRYLRAEGWAAISVKNAVAPQSMAITLTAADDTIKAIPTRIVPRGDVNRYFGKEDMGPVGYVAETELDMPAGDYMLGLELTRDGKTWRCNHGVAVRLENP